MKRIRPVRNTLMSCDLRRYKGCGNVNSAQEFKTRKLHFSKAGQLNHHAVCTFICTCLAQPLGYLF